jgi:hypothetical protein
VGELGHGRLAPEEVSQARLAEVERVVDELLAGTLGEQGGDGGGARLLVAEHEHGRRVQSGATVADRGQLAAERRHHSHRRESTGRRAADGR